MKQLLLAILIAGHFLPVRAGAAPALFDRTNLVAWCIVPFDSKKRGPEERAEMLSRLGLQRLAYDWRAEHVPTFDAEIEATRKRGIEIMAWWFPPTLNSDATNILAVIARHRIHPQLWVMQASEPPANRSRADRIAAEVNRLKPIAAAAAKVGCKVGLYNHGGWMGEVENQIAVLQALQVTNVGIVYNFHHGHGDIDRFPELFGKMRPYLLALNLNGMNRGEGETGEKILYLGEGKVELEMLRVVRESGWFGPVGILNHRTDTDAEEALRKNLQGLERLAKELGRP